MEETPYLSPLWPWALCAKAIPYLAKNSQKIRSVSAFTSQAFMTSISSKRSITITFWMWFKYPQSWLRLLEKPRSAAGKTVDKSFYQIDSSHEKVYVQMKLQCVMKDSWRIANFPYDRQMLRLAIEIHNLTPRSLVFVADTLGQHFRSAFHAAVGWRIDSCVDLYTAQKAYETAFCGLTYICQPIQ